jgi:ketosteroid isomerase-like protein
MAHERPDDDPAALLTQLLDERDIARRLMAFARGMDARDWAAVRSLLADDAGAEFGRGPEVGADRIVESIREFLDVCGPTQHLLGNIVVDVDGDTALSHAYVSDMHLGSGAHATTTFSTLGEYHDTWRRIDGQWLIVHRHKDSRAVLGSFDVFRGD